MPLTIHIIWAGNVQGALERIVPALLSWAEFPNRPPDIELFFWTHSSNQAYLRMPPNPLLSTIQIKYYDTEILNPTKWQDAVHRDLGEDAANWLVTQFQTIVKAITYLLPDSLGARASITLKEMIAMWIGGVYPNSFVVDVGCKPISQTVWHIGERTYPMFPCQCYRQNELSLVEHHFDPWYKYKIHNRITKAQMGAHVLLPITTRRPDVHTIFAKTLAYTVGNPSVSDLEGPVAWNPFNLYHTNVFSIIRIDNYAIYNGTNTQWSWFALSYAVYLAPAILCMMWVALREKDILSSLGYGYFSVGTVISALHHGLLKVGLPPGLPNLSPYTLPAIPLSSIPVKWDVAPSLKDLDTNTAIITQFGIQKSFGTKIELPTKNKVPAWIMPEAQKCDVAIAKYSDWKKAFDLLHFA